jgi:hypothetical protein
MRTSVVDTSTTSAAATMRALRSSASATHRMIARCARHHGGDQGWVGFCEARTEHAVDLGLGKLQAGYLMHETPLREQAADGHPRESPFDSRPPR